VEAPPLSSLNGGGKEGETLGESGGRYPRTETPERGDIRKEVAKLEGGKEDQRKVLLSFGSSNGKAPEVAPGRPKKEGRLFK